jgi:hypothetical protein
MLERLLGRIGAEFGVTFRRYSLAAWEQGEYSFGASTYDYDNAFQVTLCVWSDSLKKRCEEVPSPMPIVSADDEASFGVRLRDAAARLIQPQATD